MSWNRSTCRIEVPFQLTESGGMWCAQALGVSASGTGGTQQIAIDDLEDSLASMWMMDPRRLVLVLRDPSTRVISGTVTLG